MDYRCTFMAALALFGVFHCGLTGAQTSDISKGNCTHPRAIYQPEPPPYHVKKDLGVATFEILVNENGRVDDAKLSDSSGSEKFDRDALSAVKQWKFKPSRCDGKPSSARIAVQIHAVVQ